MRRNSRTTAALISSLLLAVAFSFAALTEPASAAVNDGAKVEKIPKDVSLGAGANGRDSGRSVHADPETFEKNFCLSVDQKEYAITEIDRIVSRLIKPGMSDLEKYHALAVWEYKHVKYDNAFWAGGYHFDQYRHQWDAYGVLKEKSVCVGMSILYANLCHAADLPCKFVRTDPSYLDHTVNYIPDINGNAYYVDVTENVFLMSENSADSFEPNIDKDFAGITKRCTDQAFDYWIMESSDIGSGDEEEVLRSTHIKEDCCNRTYGEWFKEFALHEDTNKDFRTPYVERGSGNGTYHASYQDFQKYPAQPYENLTHEVTGIWFLDDFFEDPKAIEQKIRDRKFDEQLLDISGLRDSYDSEDAETLESAVQGDIMVRYFPSLDGDRIVPWEDSLKTGMDYKVKYETYDSEKGEAVLTIVGNDEYAGGYKGSSRFRVRWAPKYDIGKARILPGVYSAENSGELEPKVVCLGETLTSGKDYTWEKVNPEDTFNKVGDYEVRLIGKGNYKGKALKVFRIVLSEDEAAAAVTAAKAELAAAQEAIAALGENPSPEELTAALRDLVNAQQSLIDAQDALARTRYALSEDKRAELEEQIVKLNRQIADQSEKLQLLVERSSAMQQLMEEYAEMMDLLAKQSVELQQRIEDLNDQLSRAQVIDITRYPFTISLAKSAYRYTGKPIRPAVRVAGLRASDYSVSYANNTRIGTATVIVTAKGDRYTGSIRTTFRIIKRSNTLAVKGKTAAVKYKKLKKKTRYLKVAKVIRTGNKGQGARTYATYEQTTKTVTFRIRVK